MIDSREKNARGSLKQRIARVAFKGVERGDGWVGFFQAEHLARVLGGWPLSALG